MHDITANPSDTCQGSDDAMLIFVVMVAAYALTGLVMDGAAAVRGKPLPSNLRREARQKAREHRQKNPGYLGTIWHNALDSWADASTRRHRRRIAKREAQEDKKSAEWIAKQIAKEEKWAARRQKFADKAGVLWGKARDAAAEARERRREDEAWAANARFDAERDDTVPAGLAGSADLDTGQTEDATVLPFRPRTDGEPELVSSVIHDEDKPSDVRPLHETSAAVDFLTCLWGIEDGTRCTAIRLDDSAYCGDHKLLDDRRCKWKAPDGERCAEPVYGRSPFCVEHHHADPELRAAIEESWGRPQSGMPTSDQPAIGGQDINTGIKEEAPMTNAAAISGEITGLQSGIELARQMRRYVTDVQNVLENAQGTMAQTSTGLQQVPPSLELATASLQGHGMNGPASAELAIAQERMDMVCRAVAQAVAALATVADNLGMADESFSRVEGELSSQLGISEQVGAAAARGGVARDTAFYMGN